jgi:DNA/RNA-binding domain of Phe-tRNA-synthetase-like protein
MFTVSEAWKTAYPGATVGILAMRDVANPKHHTGLNQRKEALEHELRSRFADYDRAALRSLPQLQAYHAYYKRFKKTYHVQLQLESIVLKGKSIPRVAALVEAMFMAELKNLLLTAGHDLEAVQKPVGINVAEGSESYTRLGGREQGLKSGDMMIADAQGVISSVLYGPDDRTRITPETGRVLFTVYAPPGIGEEAVRQHLEDIRAYVLLIAPEAEVEALEVYGAE